jgi:formylglycine-generating enzyme required for sulfatase activity
MPPDPPEPRQSRLGPTFFIAQANKIRLQYCEDETARARDWHAHAGMTDLFGPVPRIRDDQPLGFGTKPTVSVSWQEADEVAAALATPGVTYRLPTEAQWEVAARGGLVSTYYSWGNEPPTAEICDFNRFDQFSIIPSRMLPPNGYGLYGMCGGVWEWTADWYDAQYYAHSPADNPTGPRSGKQKVIRGGSWTDCAQVVTVSFRASRESASWRAEKWGGHLTPNIGFRLCRVASTSAIA